MSRALGTTIALDFTLSMVGAPFVAVSVRSDPLMMTGERDVPFAPVSVRSDPLVMTGERDVPFAPVSVRSDPLVMTGERDVPFVPVSVRSDPLVMTGEREVPFAPVSVRSDPLVMTGERPVVDDPPTIEVFEVPTKAVANTDVEVVVTASDDSGLDRIEIHYASDNGRRTQSVVQRILSGETNVTETFILENVREGTQSIQVLVYDQAGGRLLETREMIVVAGNEP